MMKPRPVNNSSTPSRKLSFRRSDNDDVDDSSENWRFGGSEDLPRDTIDDSGVILQFDPGISQNTVEIEDEEETEIFVGRMDAIKQLYIDKQVI